MLGGPGEVAAVDYRVGAEGRSRAQRLAVVRPAERSETGPDGDRELGKEAADECIGGREQLEGGGGGGRIVDGLGAFVIGAVAACIQRPRCNLNSSHVFFSPREAFCLAGLWQLHEGGTPPRRRRPLPEIGF